MVVVLGAGLLCGIAGCDLSGLFNVPDTTEDEEQPEKEEPGVGYSFEVGPDGGSFEAPELGVALEVPEGALSEEVTITLRAAAGRELPAQSLLSELVEFSPSMIFDLAVTVSFRFSGGSQPALFWTEWGDDSAWEAPHLGWVDGDRYLAEVEHFSLGFIGDQAASLRCDPPCGENAWCGADGCECASGYFGDPIAGCSAEDTCADWACQENAHCEGDACVCDWGYQEDPDSGACVIPSSDCDPACGFYAWCNSGSCVCEEGYVGDPLVGCAWVDPCGSLSCGANASCVDGACRCDPGASGDPIAGCTGACDEVACGANAHCLRGFCACNFGFEGDPDAGCSEMDSACGGVLAFPDPVLEQAIREQSGRPTGDLYFEDVEPILYLSWQGWVEVQEDYRIHDLSGLLCLVNLRVLSLPDNKISDLTQLDGLIDLEQLDLGGNEIAALDGMGGLVELRSLDLSRNLLRSLTGLPRASGLDSVSLADNQISDLGGFPALSYLSWLDLSRNQVADLGPLAVIAQIGTLNLSHNLLQDLTGASVLGRVGYELSLTHNQIADLAPLVDMLGADAAASRLDLRYNSYDCGAEAEHVAALRQGTRLVFSGCPLAPCTDEPSFPDPVLAWAVREQAGQPTGALRFADVEPVEYLSWQGWVEEGGGGDYRIRDLTGLGCLVNLRSLSLADNLVTDLTQLSELGALQYLDLSGNGISSLAGLAPLTRLQALQLARNQIADLGGFPAAEQLDNVDLSENLLADLSGFPALAYVNWLGLAHNQIADLGPLASLGQVGTLDLSHNQLQDLSGALVLGRVSYELYLSHNQLQDLGALVALLGRDHVSGQLDLRGNPFDCASQADNVGALRVGERLVLTGCAPPGCGPTVSFPDPVLELAVRQHVGIEEGDLRFADVEPLLWLSWQGWVEGDEDWRVRDLGGVQCLVNLRSLGLPDNLVDDVSLLQDLVGLSHLDLSANALQSLDGLTGLTRLSSLYLARNVLQDLSGFPAAVDLGDIDLSENQLRDLSGFAATGYVSWLGLAHNQVSDLGPLQGLGSIGTLDASDNQLADLSGMAVLGRVNYELYLNQNQISDLAPLVSMLGAQGASGLLDLRFNAVDCAAQAGNLAALLDRRTVFSGCPPSSCDLVTCGENAHCTAGFCFCDEGFEGPAYTACSEIVEP